MRNAIDHVSVGAASLAQGAGHLAQTLGVNVPAGSKHPMMATHNHVTRVGDGIFLELIAVDPDATPTRPRWFGLDDHRIGALLSERPRPLCWVVRTASLDATVAASPIDLGEIVTFRRGDRSWRITVPADGSLPGGGLVPAFIEWSPGPHPSATHTDLGVRLARVVVSTPDPGRMREWAIALGTEELASIVEGPTGLGFEFATPTGTVFLE